jgi:MSHA biogenesis protein MshJ
MKHLAQPLQALSARINALTPRERVILFVTGLVLVWGLTDTLLLGPGQRQREALSGQLAELGHRATAAQQALDTLVSRPDKPAEARQRRDALAREVDTRLQATAALRGHLVNARDMPRVLESLLARHPGLRLVSLKTLAPKPIAQPTGASADIGEAAYYRHGVELTLEGGYAALTGYLRGLEGAAGARSRGPACGDATVEVANGACPTASLSPATGSHLAAQGTAPPCAGAAQGVLWASADLDASDHPHLRLTLVLYTLSENRTWLKV